MQATVRVNGHKSSHAFRNFIIAKVIMYAELAIGMVYIVCYPGRSGLHFLFTTSKKLSQYGGMLSKVHQWIKQFYL